VVFRWSESWDSFREEGAADLEDEKTEAMKKKKSNKTEMDGSTPSI
jgi:hypothetical protein